jgi:hypothetical protein
MNKPFKPNVDVDSSGMIHSVLVVEESDQQFSGCITEVEVIPPSKSQSIIQEKPFPNKLTTWFVWIFGLSGGFWLLHLGMFLNQRRFHAVLLPPPTANFQIV